MSNLDIEAALRSHRRPDGRYIAPEPAPHHKPDTFAPLANALARALTEPPDPEHAREAALHLIDCFPNCRVGKAAYSEGLGDIVTHGGIPPCVVRHVCRRVRAEAKTLPPLADLRERMVGEMRERRNLLARLEVFPRQWAEARKRDAEEAARLAAAAARHGARLEPGDIVDAWRALAEGWLHERATFAALRVCEDVCPEDGDYLFATLETGRPPEAFRAAAALVPDLAEYERERNEALAAAPEVGTPEGDAWDREWLVAETTFASKIAPIVEVSRRAFGL